MLYEVITSLQHPHRHPDHGLGAHRQLRAARAADAGVHHRHDRAARQHHLPEAGRRPRGLPSLV